jgi:hypothetical protein
VLFVPRGTFLEDRKESDANGKLRLQVVDGFFRLRSILRARSPNEE